MSCARCVFSQSSLRVIKLRIQRICWWCFCSDFRFLVMPINNSINLIPFNFYIIILKNIFVIHFAINLSIWISIKPHKVYKFSKKSWRTRKRALAKIYHWFIKRTLNEFNWFSTFLLTDKIYFPRSDSNWIHS